MQASSTGLRSWAAATLLATLLAALGACAHEPRQPGMTDPSGTPAATGAPLTRQFSGKLSVQIPPQAGQRVAQGGSGSFELLGDASQGLLELSTPTGSLLARVRWTPTSVSLEQPQEQRSYGSLDALTLELLGESVPVAALFDWLRGQPWAGATALTLPAPAMGFEQLGWRVETDRLADGLLIATQQGGRAATLRVRLVRED